MGGDYRGSGGTPPKNFAWGTQTQASPPTIATFSEQKLLFFHLDYYISIFYIPILYHKTFIPFHFHTESEEYAILA